MEKQLACYNQIEELAHSNPIISAHLHLFACKPGPYSWEQMLGNIVVDLAEENEKLVKEAINAKLVQGLTLTISFKEFAESPLGTFRDIENVLNNLRCPKCGGDGAFSKLIQQKPIVMYERAKCEECKGRGFVKCQHQSNPSIGFRPTAGSEEKDIS